MNKLKKYAGLICIAIGPIAMYYLIITASSQIIAKPEIDTKIQWAVFGIVFLPIAFGLMLFGYYAFKGEYDN